MYKSPIDIIYGQMETQMEGDIVRAVQGYGINVDKAELIRALQYDRNQYEKGYADAMASIVRCKDCKHSEIDVRGDLTCPYDDDRCVPGDHFCSLGERREGE